MSRDMIIVFRLTALN